MQYIDVHEFKPLHEAPRRLGELEELRYTLLGIRDEDGFCIANFPNGEFIFPEDMREKLTALVGRKIAILRLECQYYVREVVAGA